MIDVTENGLNSPIVDEVRRVRAEHAARFGHDLWAIFRDIKEQQARSGRKFVSFADKTDGLPEPRLGPSDEEIAERAAQNSPRHRSADCDGGIEEMRRD